MVRLLNGPVAVLLAGLQLQVYLVVGAGFRAWTGFLFDRRLRGIRESTIRRRWLRWIVYSLGFALACLVLLSAAESLRPYHLHYLNFLRRVLKSPTPHRKLLGRDVITIAMLGWDVVYLVYFSRKLWSLAVSPSPANTSNPIRSQSP